MLEPDLGRGDLGIARLGREFLLLQVWASVTFLVWVNFHFCYFSVVLLRAKPTMNRVMRNQTGDVHCKCK